MTDPDLVASLRRTVTKARARKKEKHDPLKMWKYALVHAAAREHPFNPAICHGCEIVGKLLKEANDR
jgi:hypothetical protein